jgi:hypothetical protein
MLPARASYIRFIYCRGFDLAQELLVRPRVYYDAVCGFCVVWELADEVALIFKQFEDCEFRDGSLLVELVVGELAIHLQPERYLRLQLYANWLYSAEPVNTSEIVTTLPPKLAPNSHGLAECVKNGV